MEYTIKAYTQMMPKVALEDTERVTHFLHRFDVLWVEGKRAHSLVHCAEQQIELNSSLEKVQELLGDSFYRIHRSYLVNMHRIECVKRSCVVLDTGVSLDVPARSFVQVKKHIEGWLKQCED